MNEHQKKLKELNCLNQRKEIPSLSTEEYKRFINESRRNSNSENKHVNIGKMTEEAKERMRCVYGKSVSNIDIDNNGIVHAYDKMEHNLEPDDLLQAVYAINTADKIKYTNTKHQNCDVLEYEKNINGLLKILVEVHDKKDHLMIFNAMRKIKVRKRPDAAKAPRG